MRTIDADALKEKFAKHEDRKGYLIGDWEDIIDNAPTVEIDEKLETYKNAYRIMSDAFENEVRPQGKWEALNYHTCYCTNCRFDFDIMKCDFMTKMNFCPNCGADMRGGRE